MKNLAARNLSLSQYKKQIIKNKKKYDRKKQGPKAPVLLFVNEYAVDVKFGMLK